MSADSALDVAFELQTILEQLGVDCLVGGSLASSLHGEPRSTNDVDLVAALETVHVERLVDLLATDFYVDRDRVMQAVQQRSSFNVIHLATMLKGDIFVSTRDRAGRRQMERRARYELAPRRWLWVASAEDTVLQKLRWYRLGGEVSDRQWRDVLSILRVGGGSLDVGYLREMADLMDLTALLERALSETSEG